VEQIAEDALYGIDPDWRRKLATTRGIGDAWLQERRSALLKVPSVIVPDSTNILLNPAHDEAALVRIVSTRSATFDSRLFGRTG
jgi:RES domain-containing protein